MLCLDSSTNIAKCIDGFWSIGPNSETYFPWKVTWLSSKKWVILWLAFRALHRYIKLLHSYGTQQWYNCLNAYFAVGGHMYKLWSDMCHWCLCCVAGIWIWSVPSTRRQPATATSAARASRGRSQRNWCSKAQTAQTGIINKAQNGEHRRRFYVATRVIVRWPVENRSSSPHSAAVARNISMGRAVARIVCHVLGWATVVRGAGWQARRGRRRVLRRKRCCLLASATAAANDAFLQSL